MGTFRSVPWISPAIAAFGDSLAKLHADSSEMALAAVRFVQDKIRYLGMESGINGYRPHPAPQTLRQRFGDCKDKSLLLVAILQAMGMDAAPVLVDTDERMEVNQHLPNPFEFDHCIARLQLQGKTYWIDPTISNQGGSLETQYHPDYGWGLVIDTAILGLQPITRSTTNSRIQVVEDWTVGLVSEPITITVTSTFMGVEADMMRQRFMEISTNELQRDYLNYFSRFYGKVESLADVQFEDDRLANRVVTTETYKLLNPWSREETGGRSLGFHVAPSLLLDYQHNIQQVNRKQPWDMEFPLHVESMIQLHFPTEVDIDKELEEVNAKEFIFKAEASPTDDLKGISLFMSFKTLMGRVEADEFLLFAQKNTQMRENLYYEVSEETYARGRGTPSVISGTLLGLLRPIIILLCIGAGILLYLKVKGQKIKFW